MFFGIKIPPQLQKYKFIPTFSEDELKQKKIENRQQFPKEPSI